ncbi:hypothetical protein CHN50_02765 [Priestia aryabhattai]|uniref:GNAT family N-acetyltransferase n=1 Tax=Bacillaceae TaxID=186817 RepID=UPI000BA0A930|nr:MULTISPECIES: GNAT family N-acetyltransferase [Bacillaceae]MDT2046894.1 GNAT family N-acetyltransferase [Priestia flexa]OZT14504.1 hypothetical protein CHN50_02765 [Priestia aryabhattai]TDB54684.1 GNAT family N-acetyltransferase [Bacillus sp. CBEL-1]
MITFETVVADTHYIVEEMLKSTKTKNIKSVGEQFLIKLEDTYIGYVHTETIKSTCHIHTFVIHNDYQGYSFGTQAYLLLEEKCHATQVELNVSEDKRYNQFWERLGFKTAESDPTTFVKTILS